MLASYFFRWNGFWEAAPERSGSLSSSVRAPRKVLLCHVPINVKEMIGRVRSGGTLHCSPWLTYFKAVAVSVQTLTGVSGLSTEKCNSGNYNQLSDSASCFPWTGWNLVRGSKPSLLCMMEAEEGSSSVAKIIFWWVSVEYFGHLPFELVEFPPPLPFLWVWVLCLFLDKSVGKWSLPCIAEPLHILGCLPVERVNLLWVISKNVWFEWSGVVIRFPEKSLYQRWHLSLQKSLQLRPLAKELKCSKMF